MRSVAITGIGIVSPLGCDKGELFDNLMAGKSGVRRIRSDFAEQLSVKIAAEVDFDPLHYTLEGLPTFYRLQEIGLNDVVEDLLPLNKVRDVSVPSLKSIMKEQDVY